MIEPYYQDEQVTIYHGDCREILPQLEKVDAVIMDPPYNVQLDEWDCYIPPPEILRLSKSLISGGGFLAFFGMMPSIVDWHLAAKETGFSFIEHVVWVKRSMNPGGNGNRLKRGHESIYIYAAGGNRIFHSSTGRYEDVKVPGLMFDVISIEGIQRYIASLRSEARNGRPHKRSNGVGHSAYADLRASFGRNGGSLSAEIVNYTNVWSFLPPKLKQKDGVLFHPTEKPIDACLRLIEMLTPEGGSLLDCFMGSGTTLVAAQRLGRRAIGIDIREEFCETAIRRLQSARRPRAGQPELPLAAG
jgi:site-specific DNA-methyltransferase (adenine-specific)